MNFFKTAWKILRVPVAEVPHWLTQPHYPPLDGLRGVAILIVLLTHVGINRYLRYTGILLRSTTGVHIFFVLSGFLITTLLLKEKLRTGSVSLRLFYIRRVLRIIPVAYLFLLILIALDHIFKLNISAGHFLASFLFYKNLPMPNEPFTAHFWSLAVEQQFYFTFPLLLTISIDRYFLISLGIIIIVPLVAMLNQVGLGISHNNIAGLWLSKLCMYAFWKGPVIILIGSVGAILSFKGAFCAIRVKAGYITSFAMLTTAIIITMHKFPVYNSYVSTYLSGVLVVCAIVLTIGSNDLLTKVLSSKILRYTGMLSYSIYIWQQLFIGVLPWQPWLHFLAGYSLWLMIVVKLAMVYVIALVSYRYELIFLRLKRNFS